MPDTPHHYNPICTYYPIYMTLTLEEVKRNHIFDVLDMCNGRQLAAADYLDISVRTVRNYIVKYDYNYVPPLPKVVPPVIEVYQELPDLPDFLEYEYDHFPTNDQRLFYLDTGNNYVYAQAQNSPL